MLVFRSLVIGLLGACFLLLVTRPTTRVQIERQSVPVFQPAPAAATIIDVAPGLSALQVAQLVHLQPDEHVVTIDDAPVIGDLDAGIAIAQTDMHGRRYLDLTVHGSIDRRVLVLMH